MIEIHADKSGYSVPVGRRGENETRVVIFDVVSEWRRLLGDGVVELLVRRQSDSVPYPAVVTLDEDTARWVVRAADVYVPGAGEMQLNYLIGDRVVKSKQYKTFIESSMSGSDTEPPEQNWVDEVLKAGASAQDGAVRAENAATRSESAAKRAESINDEAVKIAQSVRDDADAGKFIGDTGPRGERGPIGETGPRGPQGPDEIYVGSETDAPADAKVVVNPDTKGIEVPTQAEFVQAVGAQKSKDADQDRELGRLSTSISEIAKRSIEASGVQETIVVDIVGTVDASADGDTIIMIN